MPKGLKILLIYFIHCILKFSLILSVKVVQNDTIKFGGKKVKLHAKHLCEILKMLGM